MISDLYKRHAVSSYKGMKRFVMEISVSDEFVIQAHLLNHTSIISLYNSEYEIFKHYPVHMKIYNYLFILRIATLIKIVLINKLFKCIYFKGDNNVRNPMLCMLIYDDIFGFLKKYTCGVYQIKGKVVNLDYQKGMQQWLSLLQFRIRQTM